MSVGGGVLHFYPHFPVELLCVLGGGLHCYNHFLELMLIFVCGGGAHLYQTFTWMCSNVGPQHDMPNQTSDFRLYTHSSCALDVIHTHGLAALCRLMYNQEGSPKCTREDGGAVVEYCTLASNLWNTVR